jgi:glutathione synthase/RimK-type ligase-like ATP-grasp enzyme
MNVLILGARAPAALEWARAAATAGWQVTVADSLRWPMTRFSKAGQDYVRLPEPRNNTSDWINAIQQLVIKKKVDWIIPTCEEVFYLAWCAEKLKPFCQIFTSDFSLLNQLHHKGQFAEMTQQWNLQAPKSFVIKDKKQLAAFSEKSTDYVFKPAYSRFATNTLISPSSEKLNQLEPTNEAPWIAQEFIAGKEHCSFSLIQQGEVIAHACYHPKYRVGKGSGIYFEVTYPLEILEFIKQFAQTTQYTGQVGFDFIESTDGKFYVLECNPRATSGVHLFNNQPEALTKLFVQDPSLTLPLPGEGTKTPPGAAFHPSNKPRMSSMAMILFAMIKQGWKKQFWKDYSSAEDVISHAGEYKPHYAQLLCLAEMCTRALGRRKGLLAAVTSDIEWDGQSISD